MDIRILAGILLLGRLVALHFIISVIRRQYTLNKVRDEISTLRKVMFGLSLAMLGMQIVPIIIDIAGIIEPYLKATAVPRPLGVAYAYSNMIFSIVASVMLWLIYATIDKENIALLKRNTVLEDDKAHLESDLADEKLKH